MSQTRKGTLESISEPKLTRSHNKFFYIIKFKEFPENGCYFLESDKIDIEVGKQYTFTTKVDEKGTIFNIFKPKAKVEARVNNKLEALKLAVSSFNAGKIEKNKISGMAKYLEEYLNE